MKIKLPNIKITKPRFDKHIPIILLLLCLMGIGLYFYKSETMSLRNLIAKLTQEKDKNIEDLNTIAKELEDLKNQDQNKRNESLQEEIKNIQKTYDQAVSVYENLVDLKEGHPEAKISKDLDKLFTESLVLLSKRNYSEASTKLADLAGKIKDEQSKITASFTIPQNLPQTNAPPGSGYSRQSVNVEGIGNFMVSIIAADLSSTKVVVDTASDSDCSNNCPTLSLATSISRNGGFAGVNGSYFCPASYPTCAGKTNSFDLLAMNKNKTYFNSGNNVYSTNPAVIFGNGYVRFVTAASQWGRDTGVDAVLSNYPLLVFNTNVNFGGDDDPKKGSRGGRSFVANKGTTVYIGVVHSATVAESARVLKTMGMENALNLDDGGSTALWFGGYKVGPGRDLANTIVFVKK